ncbi:uncharacterized protein LOC133807237 [Humulus lupulus]|uniref:uncharacterized protein LOC133807237 n=1 Tax=Humulus lupulus TaxID=3486 RepID=UPI002B4080E7|nr:uncharacterized protein LOC133807237 [Humulus lupulus]
MSTQKQTHLTQLLHTLMLLEGGESESETNLNRVAAASKLQFMTGEEDESLLNELHNYLDKVKNMVKPGCSEQVLKVALRYMSLLLNTLSSMSSTPTLHASL